MAQKKLTSSYLGHKDIFLSSDTTYVRFFLIDLIRKKRLNQKMLEISTPKIIDKKLLHDSGHLSNYSDFIFNIDDKHALRPMNCPGAIQYLKMFYPNFPLSTKVFELALTFRKEQTGAQSSLERMNIFHMDDVHCFTNHENLTNDINFFINDLLKFYVSFLNLPYKFFISTRPLKYLGNIEVWNKNEEILKLVLSNYDYVIDEGEGAFYGPKIDFKVLINNKWIQLSTIQLDNFLSEKLELKFLNGNYPLIVHTALFGSIERLMLLLLSHNNNVFPWWCRKEPILLINHNSSNKFLNAINSKLEKLEKNIIVIDNLREGLKIAKKQCFNYVVILGKEEEKSKKITVIDHKWKKKQVKFQVFFNDLKQKKEELDFFLKS